MKMKMNDRSAAKKTWLIADVIIAKSMAGLSGEN